MPDKAWQEARLIATSGITGPIEQERRGASALLAVLGSVREFGRSITSGLGAPAGPIRAFIEVPLEHEGRTVRPDGLIQVTRAARTWTALVEVKTGREELRSDQLETYLDVAKAQGFEVVLTVSNQIPTIVGAHPTPVNKSKLKKVSLRHLSWSQIHTEAIMQRQNRAVADPDQAWILSELIRYLEHPKSGAMDFDDMGASWVTVRESVVAGTAKPGDKSVMEVAERWDQLMQYAGMQLGRQLGIEVLPALSRREIAEPALRLQQQAQSLATKGTLGGALRIPDTVGPLQVTADLRAGRIACSVPVEAPREGRAVTRVNWLLRQLSEAPNDLRIDVFTPWSRGVSMSAQLRTARENPSLLVDAQKREARTFVLTYSVKSGTKRGQGRGSFSSSVLESVSDFYATVMQHIKAWAASPRKLRSPENGDGAAIEMPAPPELSSQDERLEELQDGQFAGSTPPSVVAVL